MFIGVGRGGKGSHGPGKDSSKSRSDQEFGGGRFGDVRLDQRLRTLLEQLSAGSVKAFPWSARLANTKAAYRFLSNERASEKGFLLAVSDTPPIGLWRSWSRSWSCTTPLSSVSRVRTSAPSAEGARGLSPGVL